MLQSVRHNTHKTISTVNTQQRIFEAKTLAKKPWVLGQHGLKNLWSVLLCVLEVTVGCLIQLSLGTFLVFLSRIYKHNIANSKNLTKLLSSVWLFQNFSIHGCNHSVLTFLSNQKHNY